MTSRGISSIATQFERLSIVSTPLRPLGSISSQSTNRTTVSRFAIPFIYRPFSSTPTKAGTWLLPTMPEKKRSRKGRPRVPTGGSARGTTLVWGDFGMRMCDHHRRISAAQLKNGEDAIKIRLKGMKYRLYKRVCASIGVYSSGNEVRMGKGKGTFDHWASRIAVVRDAFRIAGNKMPGMYEFVKKGDPPVVGITKMEGITMEELKRPRRKIPLGSSLPPSETTIPPAVSAGA